MAVFRRFLAGLPALAILIGAIASYWTFSDASASLPFTNSLKRSEVADSLPSLVIDEGKSEFPTPTPTSGIFTTTLITDKSEPLSVDNSPPLISADGRSVALIMPASQVISSTIGGDGLAIYDLASHQFSPVSFTADRRESVMTSALSADGRYVAFASPGTSFVANDTNHLWDVFLHDQETGVTIRVSVASNGTEGNGDSGNAGPPSQNRIAISADGRYVAFTSKATNLVAGDTNSFLDVFVHDRETGVTSRVSIASDGSQGVRDSYSPSLSADGRYVAFFSDAFNFAESRPGFRPTVFVHDRETGQTTPVSVTSDGAYAHNSYWPSISADGRYVAFASTSTNLIPPEYGTDNRTPQIYLHDREKGITTLISHAPDGAPGEKISDMPSISAHGRYVVFESDATNLLAGETVPGAQIYLYDSETGLNRLLSVSSSGAPIPGARSPSISGDGRAVTFAVGRSVYVHQPGNKGDEEGGQCFPPNTLSASTGDSDGDGLLDQWETCGFDANGDGIVDVDLPAMGADPKHKDIFVQIDYMVAQDHTHHPAPYAIQTVVNAFDQAPYQVNPDKKPGIHLHVDFGKNAPLPWGKTPTWGNLSRSKQVTEQQYIGTCTGDPNFPNFNRDDFDKIKKQNFPNERMKIFHYNIWAHSLCALSNVGGISLSAPGSDFIVSLGNYYRFEVQTGAFMHELGHNLGLCHGGPNLSLSPSTGCSKTSPYETPNKPNYFSVMNYYFSYYGLIINGQYGNYNYSQFDNIPSLNENMLDETVGLTSGVPIANYITRYYCNPKKLFVYATQPIDWNCDGNITSTNIITADINNDSAFTTLDSYNDWRNLSLPLPAAQDNRISNSLALAEVIGSAADDIPAGDIPLDLIIEDMPPYMVSVESPFRINLHPGETTTFTITVTNLGVESDSYTFNYTAEHDWLDHATFPVSLDLAGGTKKTVPITIHVPDNISLGTENEITISALSHSASNLWGSTMILVTVNSGSNPSVFLPLITK